MKGESGPEILGAGGTVWSSAIFSDLLGDSEIAEHFSDRAVLNHYRQFEVALLEAKEIQGLAAPSATSEAVRRLNTFEADLELLGQRTGRDGVTIAGFIDQVRQELGQAAAKALHSGSTSQDVMDSATALCLRDANATLKQRLDTVISKLDALVDTVGDKQIMARTRMQAALPIASKDRIVDWRRPLQAIADDWERLNAHVLWLQFGGPVGDRRGFDGKADALASEMSKRLGLIDPGHAWHSDRRPIIAEGEMLSRLTGALGKLGQDVALMAQNGIDAVSLSGAGGSSAMAHKTNPVAAEVLVALARFNAGQIGLLHGALVHEQERSGAAWTLEWMVLPQMCLAAGRALLLAARLIGQIEGMGEAA